MKRPVKPAFSFFAVANKPCGMAACINLAVLAGVLDSFLHVTNFLLQLASSFAGVALGLLLGVAESLAGVFLDFTSDFLDLAFDLVLVHDLSFSNMENSMASS